MILEALKNWYDRVPGEKLRSFVYVENTETDETFHIIGVSDYDDARDGYGLLIKHKKAEHSVTIKTKVEESSSRFGGIKLKTFYEVCINDQPIMEFDEECKALMLKNQILEAFTCQK